MTACGKTQQVHNAASRIASRPIYHCLRWAVSDSGPLPPCLETSEPLGTGVDTHTHTHTEWFLMQHILTTRSSDEEYDLVE